MRRLPLAVLSAMMLLGACDSGIKPTAVADEAANAADQVLVGMTHMLTGNGVRRAKVEADTTYINSAAQVADLRNVTVTFYDLQGLESSTLTSREGTYQLRSGDMEGRGDVVVVTKDGGRLTTDVVRYSQAKDSVSSDAPFVFDSPDRHIEGDGFTSDPSFKTVITKRPKGTGGRFVLPNQ
jgi:LPS export ABC transporter protein LptC